MKCRKPLENIEHAHMCSKTSQLTIPVMHGLLPEALKGAECVIPPTEGRIAGSGDRERALIVVAVVVAIAKISPPASHNLRLHND